MRTRDVGQGSGPLQQPVSPLFTPGAAAPLRSVDFSALAGQDHNLPLASAAAAAAAQPKLALSDLIVHSQAVITDSQCSQVCYVSSSRQIVRVSSYEHHGPSLKKMIQVTTSGFIARRLCQAGTE